LSNEKRYVEVVSQSFLDDLNQLKNTQIDPKHWGLFQDELSSEWKKLNENWEYFSKKTKYPPLSTYDYRKRYMHSIPLREKQRQGWEDLSSDFRIIFKVREDKGEIFYLGIGKRIKTLPKDPSDIWSIMKGRKLPEQD